MKKVTIYTGATFGIQKYEGTLVDCGTKKYAQYDNAPFVAYIPKGKRKTTGFIKGYKPYILIVEGFGHPAPDDMFLPPIISETGVAVSKTRYSCFDDKYSHDFDAKIAEHLKTCVVIMDNRFTQK